jgi:hypothetical protein
MRVPESAVTSHMDDDDAESRRDNAEVATLPANQDSRRHALPMSDQRPPDEAIRSEPALL